MISDFIGEFFLQICASSSNYDKGVEKRFLVTDMY